MTSTNFANLKAVGANISAGKAMDAGRSKNHEQEMASVFSSMMAQTPQSSQAAGAAKESAAEPVSSTQAYDSYQYRDNHVEAAKETSIAEKIETGEEELEQFGQDVVNKVAEVLGVEVEAVEEALNELNLTPFDLLNPQNLVQAVKAIDGIGDDTQLLFDGDFQQLLKDLGQMGDNLMAQMNLREDQLHELTEQMRMLAAQQEPAESQEMVQTAAEPAVEVVFENRQDSSRPEVSEETVLPVREEDTAFKQEQPLEAEDVSGEFQPMEEGEVLAQQTGAQEGDGSSFTSGEQTQTGEKNPFRERSRTDAQPQAEQIVTADRTPTQAQLQEIAQAPSPNASYVASHVMDIIRQVAENVRIVMSSESTSMEMQLNPENLGKIYLNVTTQEGVVSAHLRAQDEAVRAALESQLATLRENLNQAGIKVDAIEVTVATHEFERNLEQNQGGEAQPREEEANPRRTRRNLSMDSLDEISGLMTEEEQLAAQIMRDNGNSVDLMA